MTTSTPLPRVPVPGRHGGDAPAVERALDLPPGSLLDLSQSMNPFAPPIEPIVARHLDQLRRYPDPGGATAELAAALEVDAERLLLTNGGSEAIALVAAELGGRPRSEPEFALHPRHDGAIRWRSDPHNPSGSLAGPDDRADVWDEAFLPLATGRWWSGRPEIVLGSLTKVFSCPGLRLGFVLADDVARFGRRQPQWSVGPVALATVPDLLAVADLVRWRDRIARRRREVAGLFTEAGFTVRTADAPWILVEGRRLRDRLVRHGVLVRDCASFGMTDTVRVGLPDDTGLGRLTTAVARTGSPDGETPR